MMQEVEVVMQLTKAVPARGCRRDSGSTVRVPSVQGIVPLSTQIGDLIPHCNLPTWGQRLPRQVSKRVDTGELTTLALLRLLLHITSTLTRGT